MKKYEELEKLKSLKDNGTITEVEFESEKQKILNKEHNKRILGKIVVVLVNIIAILLIVLLLSKKAEKNLGNKQSNSQSNQEVNISTEMVEGTISKEVSSEPNNTDQSGMEQTSENFLINEVSFANLSGDNEELDDIQKNIVNYFDENYFWFMPECATRYPKVFENAKVENDIVIVKVLKSTDEEFEVLAVDCGDYHYASEYMTEDISSLPQDRLLVVSGTQLTKRLVKNDVLFLKGRYNGVKEYNIDGKSYILPNISSIKTTYCYDTAGNTAYAFDFDTIKSIAEYIFGKDIKISDDGFYLHDYTVTLDNQSNANFSKFRFSKDGGYIDYYYGENDWNENIEKHLFISADFAHYIVSTYDKNTKHVYIDYFNRELQKEWSKEFDYKSTKAMASPMDYSNDKMAVVVDNDLYLLNIKTGTNIIEPITVGEKNRVIMMSDGIILVGDNNKDAIMKVDYSGNILFKINADTQMSNIYNANLQIVNGKLVVKLYGDKIENGELDNVLEKYLIIDNNGTVELSTEDMQSYM